MKKIIPKEAVKTCSNWAEEVVSDHWASLDKGLSQQINSQFIEVEPDEEAVTEMVTQQLESVRQEAYQQGLQQGLQESQQYVNQIQAILTQMNHPLSGCEQAVKARMIEIIIFVAQQVVHQAITLKPEMLQTIFDQVLASLDEQSGSVKVYVNPQDYLQLEKTLQSEQLEQFVAEANISRGGARVIVDHAEVNATVEKRLLMIAEQLRGEQ